MNKSVIDIETVSLVEPATPDAGSEPAQADGDRGALNPLSGRIVCIGMIFLKDRYEPEYGISVISKNE